MFWNIVGKTLGFSLCCCCCGCCCFHWLIYFVIFLQFSKVFSGFVLLVGGF